jgi:hypothetical protein
MFTGNAQKIFDIVNSLVATTKLTVVYNYDTKTSDSYPYSTVSVWNWESDFYDTTNNEMISTYIVSVYYRDKNIDTTEWYIRELVDQILTELNKKTNLTLEGTVTYMKPVWIQWWWIESDESKRVCDISVEVKENISV